jgi:hypothetical protein
MQWVAAEQLLEHESEPEPDYGQAEPPHWVAPSLAIEHCSISLDEPATFAGA